MAQDPSTVVAAVVKPRPVAGFRRLVQASHPAFGDLSLLTTEASVGESGNPSYTKYAYSPGFGAKQKTIHTAGTKEINWSVGGEVTESSLGIVKLLHSAARGVGFAKLLILQGQDNFFFHDPSGVGLPWNSLTLNGNQNAGMTFSLEGKSTILPVAGVPNLGRVLSGPVPTWATGNTCVLSWSMSHNTNLAPSWYNTAAMLPAYYRAGDSEYTIQVTTAAELHEHTLIKIGFGYVSLLEAVVTSRNRVFGDRNGPVTYQVSSTNVRIQDRNAYTDFVDIFLNGIPESAYYP